MTDASPKPKRRYKRYSSEFKREALLRACEEGPVLDQGLLTPVKRYRSIFRIIDARPDLTDVLVLSIAADTSEAQEKYGKQLNRGQILSVTKPLDCAL